LKTLLAILKSLCLLAAIVALAEADLAFREVAKLMEAAAVTVTEAGGTAAELRKTATAVSEYAQHQTKQLMDPRNHKALDAGGESFSMLRTGSTSISTYRHF